MPRFIDVHHHAGAGLTARDLAEMHARDLAVQENHSVRFLKYWYDPVTGKIFCLAEAPDKEAVLAAHQDAQGETADEIFEVFEGG
jgi:Protein of unknown function (DUF4242)